MTSAEPARPLSGANPQAATEIPQESPWQRLRERFAMSGCHHSPAVVQQAHRYARSPARLSAQWQEAMPLLLLVLDELEKRNIPGELALLPFVESHYRLVPGKGGGPAGMWQLMPRTARDHGLRVDPEFDERLDAVASTRVALDLMQRLYGRFGDWRLATMGFNAGEYRVKAALGRTHGTALSAAGLERLKLSPVTHQHLARVLALACLVAEPQRFGMQLPPVAESDFLELVTLPTPIDLILAAHLAGLSGAELSRYNSKPSVRSGLARSPHRLLLPKSRVMQFNSALDRIPEAQRGSWRNLRVQQPTTLSRLSAQLGVDESLLSAANTLGPGAELRSGQELLVPADSTKHVDDGDGNVHVIQRGDTLSEIARRYGVGLGALMRWNALDKQSTLRIGARLKIRAPGY
jgi:membrane-bound lytic murein transglycosylase D